MAGHAHDSILGLSMLKVESPGFQPDVQEDLLGDFFGQGWLFQNENGKGIPERLVSGAQDIKGVFVDLGAPMNQWRSSNDS